MKHAPLHDDADEDVGLPDCAPLQHDEARRDKRRALMLDDGCLNVASVEHRRYDPLSLAVYLTSCVLTLGTVAIIAYWPMCRRRKQSAISRACAPEDAEFVIVTSSDGSYEVCAVEEVSESPLELQPYWQAQRAARNRPASSIPPARRMYVFRHTRFRYRPSARAYLQVECEEVLLSSSSSSSSSPTKATSTITMIHDGCGSALCAGLAAVRAHARLVLLGKNVIDVPIPPIPILLVREVLHPFVIFQVWAVIVWLTESYWSFSIFILCTALLTAGLNLRDVLRNLRDIRALSRYVTPVTVLRPNPGGGVPSRVVIPSDELVPGDVLVLHRSLKLPADMVLVQGQATVTEAMLTGEATVVVKTPVVPHTGGGEDVYTAVNRGDIRNTLFCGTQVVELRVPKGQDVLAVVVRTGYETVKGRLVLSILYPRTSHFKFMEEAIKFVGILFGCAMVGFVVNAKALADNGAGPEKIVQRGADLITIVVPPALPLAVTVGTLYALMSLRKDHIFCISPNKVNLAGKINAFCFDKTGTLTTEGLELATVRQAVSPSRGGEEAGASHGPRPPRIDTRAIAEGLRESFEGHSAAPPSQSTFLPDTDVPAELCSHFAALLASCHSLTHVGGTLSGDPLELKTFAFTRSRLLEPHTEEEEGGREGATVMAMPSSQAGGGSSSPPASLSPVQPLSTSLSPLSSSSSSSSSTTTFASLLNGKAVPAHVMSRVFLPSAAQLREPASGSAHGSGPTPTTGTAGGAPRPAFAPTARPYATAAQAVDVLHAFSFVPALQRMGVLVQPVLSPGESWLGGGGEEGGDGGGSHGTPLSSVSVGSGRSGTVSATPDAPVVSYVKGSPEALHALCTPSSLPPDFWGVLEGYARQGLRVLGAGYKLLPPSYAHRAVAAAQDAALSETLRREVEAGLTFLGFIVLENRLKPETSPTLARLRKEAALSLHMATGDNGVSAIAVARQCGMVEPGARVFLCDVAGDTSPAGSPSSSAAGTTGGPPRVVWIDVDDPSNGLDPGTLLPFRPITPLQLGPSTAAPTSPATHSALLAQRAERAAAGGLPPGFYRLAMTGRAFEALKGQVAAGTLPSRTLSRAVINCAVFARMSPDAKASLVEALQAMGLYVGMIGDGANDSMALRAAHVGISLSQVEASVAAPFTYAVPNPSIDAIPRVLAEGRGALATSFCLFQFMALYSTIQFATAVQIAFSGSFLSNNMYLFQDLFVVFILSFSLGQTPSARVLTVKRPSGRLGSVHNLAITFGFIFLTFALQAAAYFLVRSMPWFGSAENPSSMDPSADEEGTNSAIPETTSLFLMANFQYLACATIFSAGGPWKASASHNKVFCGWMVVVGVTSTALLLGPTEGAYKALSLQRLPSEWNWSLFALSLVAVLAYFAFMALIRVAKTRGVFAWLERRGPPKLHKVLRGEWRAQFAAPSVAAGGGHAAVGVVGGVRVARPDSSEWNTRNSLVDPTTPLPLR